MSENEDLQKAISNKKLLIISILRALGIGPSLVTGAALFEIGVELLVVGGVDRDALEVRFHSLITEAHRLRSALKKVNGNPMAAEPPLPQ
jgi:hypothetical protein